ncbi:MAG TPA: RdgB/HAM1 family non-canonical purine NTP pyrophosphatase [Pyrinomonadaceae bacterium]|jgi:XTP/dITP diphosphohydrolase
MNENSFQILVATGNPGKIAELKKLLADLPFDLLSLKDFPDVTEVAETGSTFAENARLKAQGYAQQTGLLSLADDSGLEVSALGGAPGVYSARYAGENVSDRFRMEKLLEEVRRTGSENRSARFVCAMALARKNSEIIHFVEEYCEGTIAAAPRGANGFGYDPVFIPSGFDKTFGELPETVKGKISHRARAAIKIIRYLRDFIAI